MVAQPEQGPRVEGVPAQPRAARKSETGPSDSPSDKLVRQLTDDSRPRRLTVPGADLPLMAPVRSFLLGGLPGIERQLSPTAALLTVPHAAEQPGADRVHHRESPSRHPELARSGVMGHPLATPYK